MSTVTSTAENFDPATVIVTEELYGRFAVGIDASAILDEIVALVRCLADEPGHLAERLVDAVYRLTGAGSAGLSLEEDDAGAPIFRWIATSGRFANYLGGTMPRHFSPCGTVVDLDMATLMRDAVDCYPYVAGLHTPVRELLLVPFKVGGRNIGTLWAVAHDDRKLFNLDDLTVIEKLCAVAAAGIQTTQSIAALHETQKRLVDADRHKDEFVATLAHELRNPLAPIRQASQILRSQHTTDAQKAWSLDVIERQTHTLGLLLNDLLDVAQVSGGRIELRRERVRVETLVAGAVETVRPMADAKKHRLHVDSPLSETSVDGDPLRLTQVITNLLTNAVKYTDVGGDIWIAHSTSAEAVTISVRDSGIGIAPEAVTTVFDMYKQLPAAGARTAGGLGIGLALSRGLAELHGGTLDARSDGQGLGSEFIFRIPVRVRVDADSLTT